MDKTWLIPSTDTKAGATRLHFTRLDLEEGVDWLIVTDVEDAEIQRFTGTHAEGFWTDQIPGSIAKVHLITDKSVEQWGFAVDMIAGSHYTTLAYSPHPYPFNSERKWQFNNVDPTATATRLHFSTVDLEDGVDWLVVTGVDDTPYQWITGSHPDGLWTLGVSGTVINVKLISDASVGKWGFNVDGLESAPLEAPQSRPESEKILAESAHPYTNETLTWTLVNTDPHAAFSKVHITRLDIDDGELRLLDGSNNTVQVFFGNTHRKDFWSDDLPGRVVKVQFTGSYYGRSDWGLRLDQLSSGSNKASLSESQHPYINEIRTWTLVNPDPQAVFTKIHITRLDIDEGELKILDGSNNTVQVFFGNTHRKDFWSDDVPGRVVKVQFTGSYYGRSDWGFRVDQLATGASK